MSEKTANELLGELLLQFEGESLKPYRCPADIPTIGVGLTEYPDGRRVTMKDPPLTQEQSREMLRIECDRYLQKVEEMLTREATKHQLVAFASLGYNIGLGALKKSTPLRAHNAGDTAAAARGFGLWNKARVNGKLVELRGLTARRAAEAALYLTPEPTLFQEAPVQAVEDESSLTASPINVAGATGVVAGGTTLVTELFGGAMPVLQQAKEAAEILNLNPSMLLGIAVLAAGGVSIFYRWKQRSGGWA